MNFIISIRENSNDKIRALFSGEKNYLQPYPKMYSTNTCSLIVHFKLDLSSLVENEK